MPHATCLETQVPWLRTEISNICCGNPQGGLWDRLWAGDLCPALASDGVADTIWLMCRWPKMEQHCGNFCGGPQGLPVLALWFKWRQMPQWGWEGDHPYMAFTQKWPQHVNPQCCYPNWKGNYPKTKTQWKDSLALIKSQKAWSQQMRQPGVKQSSLLPSAAGLGYLVQLTLGMS